MKVQLGMVLLGSLLLGVPHALAQEAPAEEPAARFGGQMDVVEILVDVLATDRRGRVVKGLTADDFVVEEGGEPREITGVTFYSSRYEDLPPRPENPTPAPEGFPPPDLPASRYFVLFFHDQTTNAADRAALTSNRLRSAREAKLWVDQEMAPSDWIAVVHFDHELSVQLDFSQERLAIKDAIEAATLNKQTSAMRPSTRARREHPGRGPSLTANLPHVADIGRSARRMEHAVQLVADASRPIIGRKNMVIFTLGFASPDSALGGADVRYYPGMKAALNTSNMAVYPIDLSGSSNQSPSNNFLSQLADDTGGIYFATFNRFLDPLRDISRYNTGYYLLSFKSEAPAGEMGYREFRVKSKTRKVRVKARRGYSYGR